MQSPEVLTLLLAGAFAGLVIGFALCFLLLAFRIGEASKTAWAEASRYYAQRLAHALKTGARTL